MPNNSQNEEMPGKAAALEEIGDTLPEIMHRMASSRPLTAGEWELTLAQVRALHTVGSRGPLTMGELAHSLGIGLSAATGLVDRLVQQGVVEREVDPNDRRQVQVRLARAGREAAACIRAEKRRRLEAALGHLSERELKDIARALTRLQSALEKSAGEDLERKR